MTDQSEASWKPYIRVLLYPAQFESSPKGSVEKLLDCTVATETWRGSAQNFRKSIDLALASREDLARLIPQPHSDSALREYLSVVKERLLRWKP